MVIKGIKKREREGKRGEKEEFIEGEDRDMPPCTKTSGIDHYWDPPVASECNIARDAFDPKEFRW